MGNTATSVLELNVSQRPQETGCHISSNRLVFVLQLLVLLLFPVELPEWVLSPTPVAFEGSRPCVVLRLQLHYNHCPVTCAQQQDLYEPGLRPPSTLVIASGCSGAAACCGIWPAFSGCFAGCKTGVVAGRQLLIPIWLQTWLYYSIVPAGSADGRWCGPPPLSKLEGEAVSTQQFSLPNINFPKPCQDPKEFH